MWPGGYEKSYDMTFGIGQASDLVLACGCCFLGWIGGEPAARHGVLYYARQPATNPASELVPRITVKGTCVGSNKLAMCPTKSQFDGMFRPRIPPQGVHLYYARSCNDKVLLMNAAVSDRVYKLFVFPARTSILTLEVSYMQCKRVDRIASKLATASSKLVVLVFVRRRIAGKA